MCGQTHRAAKGIIKLPNLRVQYLEIVMNNRPCIYPKQFDCSGTMANRRINRLRRHVVSTGSTVTCDACAGVSVAPTVSDEAQALGKLSMAGKAGVVTGAASGIGAYAC